MSLAESTAAVARRPAIRPLDAACLAVMAAAHIPLLLDYFARLWSSPHYDFFPLALAGAAYLAYRDRDRFQPAVDDGPHWAIPAFVCGAVLLTAAVLFESQWLAVVSFVWHLGAIAFRTGGVGALRALVPSALMCLTFLRLPLGLDERLVQSLQTVTARMSSAALDVLNVLHVRAGNVIEIPGRRLLVEEACSGVNSLFAATACTLFFVLWRRLGVARSLMLLLTVPFWTVVANSARVVATAVLRYHRDIAADEGRLHDALGMGVFAVAMLLVLSTAAGFEFLRYLFGGRPPEADEPAPIAAPSTRPAGMSLVPVAAAAFALVICVIQVPGTAARLDDHRARARLADLAEIGEGALPAVVGGERRQKFERVKRFEGASLGEISQTWYYDGAQTRSAASLDYPFIGWHEITECYIAQGWQVDSRSLVALEDQTTVVEVVMHKADRVAFGHLLFTVCDPAGNPIAPWRSQSMSFADEWIERAQMMIDIVRGNPRPESRPTAQFQLFTESFTPLDEGRRAALRSVYGRLRQDVRPHLARAAEASP
jgi:exosortase